MQHATCNMQHATCNKLGKFSKLFAVLALTFATLATPSALGYKAVAIGEVSILRPAFEGIGDTQALAIADAIAECEATNLIPGGQGGGNNSLNCPTTAEVTIFLSGSTEEPACVAMYQDDNNNDNVYPYRFNDPNLPNIESLGADACQLAFSTSSCESYDIAEVGDRNINGNGNAEFICDTEGVMCGDTEVPDENNEGNCRTATIDDCEDTEVFVGGNCEACPTNASPNDAQTACACDATYEPEGDLADGGSCEESCGDNSTRDGTTCTCNAGFDSEDGKNCMSICGANSEFQAGENGAEDTCTCESGFEGDAEGKNCMSIDCGMNSQLIEGTSTCECISDDYLGDTENKNCVLQITQGETFVFSGITNGHTAATAANIANADAGALQITINTEVDGISYSKDGGDDALVLNGAVVSFAEISVAAATYSIFIAATNEESVVVATISLYLAVAPIPPETPPGIPSSDTSGKQFLGIIGTGMVAIAAYWLISDWVEKARWTPSYAFANNNGNVSYSVGSRWTAAEDNWRVYWQTRQNNDTFAYGSGIGYNNGILSAAMNSESQTDKTAIDLDLAANKTVGLWNIGGGYRFDMELSETETETKNRLNAKVRYTMDKWILSANAKTDGKRGTARINYSYRF